MVLTLSLIVVAVLWSLATVQGIWSLVAGIRFLRFVGREVARPIAPFEPRAAIILPCCGIDDRLADTVRSLELQIYRDYEVVFTFESVEDPAYAAVGRWTARWGDRRHRRVVAGRADDRSQKIHNLLAALKVVSPDREVLVFLDSDAVPGPNWLRHLVAPLVDNSVGAATGFRWYTTNGNIASGIRSAWNAATVTFLHEDKLNFCWGGSTAIRRATFDRLGVAESWQRALSDDYQVTRAVRNAGLLIRFVPQCLIPCLDHTTMRGFLTFARRQLVITRVCAPVVWRAGLALACNFILGGTAVAALAAYAFVNGMQNLMFAAIGGWALILMLGASKSILRQFAVRKVLSAPSISWKDFCWDVVGVAPIGVLHLALLLSSARSRRITWRSTVYEMVSPDETLVLGRHTLVQPTPAMQPVVGLT